MKSALAGIGPDVTQKLGTRQPANSGESDILTKLRQLYACDANQLSSETYSIFKDDAIFTDPPGYADGKTHIQEQFNGLFKIFSKGTMDKQELLENPSGVGEQTMLVDQYVTYYRSEDKPFKTINSLVIVERDPQGKVYRMEERWDHKVNSDASDGFFGWMSEQRKRLFVNITGIFVDAKPPN